MPINPTVATQRGDLARAGWGLTELAGGPWIVYGYNGDAPLCVMGRTRADAWRQAAAHAARLGPGPGKDAAVG